MKARIDPATGQPLPAGVYRSGLSHYQFRLQPRGTDAATGKRLAPIVRGGFLSAEDAAIARDAMAAELGQGIAPESVTVTVAAYVGQFITDHAADVRATTIARYTRLAERFIVPDAIAKIPLRDLSPDQVESWVKRCTLRSTAGQAAQARRLLIQVLHRAERFGRITRNVATLSTPPKTTPKDRRSLSQDEAHRLVTAIEARHDTLRAAWYLLLFASLRPGEVLALRWDDLDIDAGVIHIRRTVTRNERGQYIIGTAPKTPSSRRSFPLPAVCVSALKEHRRALNERRLAAPVGVWQEQGLVFPGWDGAPRRHHSLSRRLGTLCGEAGIDPAITPHELRHSGATIARQQGVEPEVLQRRLGHKKITTTLGVYSHLGDDLTAQRGASDAMQAVWERLRPSGT